MPTEKHTVTVGTLWVLGAGVNQLIIGSKLFATKIFIYLQLIFESLESSCCIEQINFPTLHMSLACSWEREEESYPAL